MKNFQKGSAIVWVVILILVLLGIGAYIYSRNSHAVPSVTGNNTLEENISDWKTYTNPYLGISLKYPEGWFVLPTQNPNIGDIALMVQSPDRHDYFVKHPDGPGGPIAEINISKESIRNEGQPVSFNGMSASKTTYSGDGPQFESILINRGNYTYDIRTETTKNALVSQILSTIKFTN